MKKIKVNLQNRSYNIIIGHKILSKLVDILRHLDIGKDAVIITNANIKNKYALSIRKALLGSGFTIKFLLIPDSEKSKSIKEAMRLVKAISGYDKKKRIFIIALGGGVVGDLTGFVASIYKRGIPYIQIPTTLLAQIDSSIGGKTAVDLDIAKNQLGVFYQPRLVFSDTNFLKTLNKRQLISGLAEAVKYAIIKDKQLFYFLERNYKKIISQETKYLEYLIYRCSLIKAKVVSLDEKEEKGRRTILNFGHTIGHAIEAASGYKGYNHGEAIALGILVATNLSRSLGILDNNSLRRIKNLLSVIGLPTRLKNISHSAIIKAYLHDKKFIAGINRFVLVKRIGSVLVKQNVPLYLIKKALSEISQ